MNLLRLALALVLVLLPACLLFGQDLTFPGPKSEEPNTAAAPAPTEEHEKPSPEAERIARAHRTVESTRKLVADLQAQIDDPEGEYQKFQESFVAADTEYEAKKKEIDALKAGDVERALSDLSAELRSQPGELMAMLPLPLTSAEVESVTKAGAGYTAVLHLVGGGPGGNNPPEFASTHPSAGTRMQHLQSLMPKAMEYRQKFCTQGGAGAATH